MMIISIKFSQKIEFYIRIELINQQETSQIQIIQFSNTQSKQTTAKQYVSQMPIRNSVGLQSIYIIKLLVFLSIIDSSLCARGPYQPKNMDYELRRPITYLYNRLAYKFDFNPYTSHLVNTQKVCSSHTGPNCGFINRKELMQQKLSIQANYVNLHHALVVSAPQNKEVAFQIERGELDVFLISGDSHKEYDKYVKGQIEKDFYDALPSHKKNPQSKKIKTQIRKSTFGFVPNAN